MPQNENIRKHKLWEVEGTLDIKTGATFKKDGVDITEQLAFTKYTRSTIAEVNAGVELLPAITGKAYRITGIKMRAFGGAVTSVTSIEVEDSNGTPVVVASFAVAQLLEDALLQADATGVTLGVGFLAGTTVAKSIRAEITGSDITVATHVDTVIEYQLIDG